jgi:NTP pyrophosphatase (non-canonical NTP hydrolase)
MMSEAGLTKLIEECGELIQIAAKRIAYHNSYEHPDGQGPMFERLENEISDVQAACRFVTQRMQLDEVRIAERTEAKLLRFQHWEWPEDPQYFHENMLEPSP